jgi:hypothetical protein
VSGRLRLGQRVTLRAVPDYQGELVMINYQAGPEDWLVALVQWEAPVRYRAWEREADLESDESDAPT